MSVIKMTDLDLAGKRVFIRVSPSISVKEGKVTNDAHIRASLPTIGLALKQDVKVMVTSHLGRPTEGEYNEEFSLLPIVNYLEDKLSTPIHPTKDYPGGIEVAAGRLMVLEDVRFNEGEKKGDEVLPKEYAALCDIFATGTFSTAHRTQASTRDIGKLADITCVNPLLAAELNAPGKAPREPTRPMVTIVGDSRVPTRLTVLDSLSETADRLIVGGGIANISVVTQGYNVGGSLYEADLVDEARHLLTACDTLVPTDARVATEFSGTVPVTLRSISDMKEDEQILDIGSASTQQLTGILENAKTILQSDPVDVFESPSFRKGTGVVTNTIADSEAFSIADGGDTLAAADLSGIADKISYISTSNGASLELVEGKVLPAIAMLGERVKKWVFNGQGNLPNYQRALGRTPFPRPKIQDP